MNDRSHPPLEVDAPSGGFAPLDAADAVVRSGLAELLLRRAAGPFGHTSRTLAALEALAAAVDLGLAAAARLEGLLREELGQGAGSFALPPLAPEHRRLAAALQTVVTADALEHGMAPLGPTPRVEGALAFDGLDELLADEAPATARAERVLRLARAFVEGRGKPARDSERPADAALRTLRAFFALLRRAVLELARGGALRPLVGALEGRGLRVGGRSYRGLELQAPAAEREGLLPLRVEDIVGNESYLQAGLRLVRDVAAYDFDRRCNPKRFNPILFGLGRPGSGKTATAHALGHAFLDHCARRNVPARFLVVRRTDWASSYQNASAANLVRIFREQVYGFPGVCGAYWADIDTAFASRDSQELRQEEKQNLAAVFAIFDGTLLPKDGKWFLICDANTLHMDEATISRIAQNPHTVAGPTEPAHFVRLMRDVLLRDVRSCLPADPAAWERIGEQARALGLSGRNVEAVCGNIRAWVQDFEYPEAYFTATPAERERLVAGLLRPADEACLLKFLRDWAAFRRDAETQAEQQRFDGEVLAIVRRLNAARVAAEQATELDEADGR